MRESASPRRRHKTTKLKWERKIEKLTTFLFDESNDMGADSIQSERVLCGVAIGERKSEMWRRELLGKHLLVGILFELIGVNNISTR